MNFKKLAAALLAAAMALCLAGCASGEKPAVIATYDGGEIPSGLYVFNQVTALNNALSLAGNPYSDADDILTRKIDGVPGEQWINDMAADMTRIHAAVQSEVDRLGLTLEDTVTAEVQAEMEASWAADGAAMEEMGISFESMKMVSMLNLLSTELFEAYYGEGGSEEVPEEELKDFFLKNYRRSLMMIVSLVDNTTGEPLDDERAAAARAAYEDYKARVGSGESILDMMLLEEQRLNDLNGVEAELPEVTEENQEVLFSIEGSGYPEGIRDMLFDENAPLNTPLFYEDENFLVIFDIRDTFGDGSAFENSRLSLLTVYKADDFQARIEEVASSINFTMDQNALKAFPVRGLFLNAGA